MKTKIRLASLAYTSIGACFVSTGILFFQNSFVKYVLLGVGIVFCLIAVIIAAKTKTQ
jgi:hypothetical protein